MGSSHMMKIKVHGVTAHCVQPILLTTGMVGVGVSFQFDRTWEKLSKCAVFIGGTQTRDVILTGEECVIPHEVLQEAGAMLRVGVYGVNAAGDLVIPTVYAECGVIRSGTDPSGDESYPATPDVVAQLLNKLQGGGLSAQAKTLLITVLRSAIYTTDQSANIAALMEALACGGSDDSGDSGDSGDTGDGGGTEEGGDTPVTVHYSVTNRLSDCVSSNSTASVAEGAAYSATLRALDGFVLTSVTVTMGGVDVTGAVYDGGSITISAVVGNVVITAVAVEQAAPVVLPFENGKTYTSAELEWAGGYEYTGTAISASTWGDMVYFPCTGANRVVCNDKVYYNQAPLMMDENKQVIRQGMWAYIGSDKVAYVARDAAYLCVEAAKANMAGLTLTPYCDPLWTGVYEIGQWYRTDTWTDESGYNDSTGQYGPQSGYCCTGLLPVYGVSKMETGYSRRHFYYFFDAQKNFLKYQAIGSATTSANLTFEIPEGAHYMAISTATAKANFAFRVVE